MTQINHNSSYEQLHKWNEQHPTIGKSDRGIGDSEDTIYMSKTPLKTGLNAHEAEVYADNRNGAEIVVRETDGTYSVYPLYITEKGKSIQSIDFAHRDITLTKDVLDIVGGEQAYVNTTTDRIRTLGIPGIELDDYDTNFAETELSIKLEDADGIETESYNDLQGTLDGVLILDKAMIEYGVNLARKETGYKFILEQPESGDKSFKIKAYVSGVKVGNIYLKPDGNGIKISVGGAAGALVGTTEFLLESAISPLNGALSLFGADSVSLGVEDLLEPFVNSFAKGMGFKAKIWSATSGKLYPDLANSPMLQEIPLGKTSLDIEQIHANSSNYNISMNSDQNLQIKIDGARVIASSGEPPEELMKLNYTGDNGIKKLTAIAERDVKLSSYRPESDSEGKDKIEIELKAQLSHNLETIADTEINTELHITPDESEALSNRLEDITGMSTLPSMSGDMEISDVHLHAELNKKGKLTEFSSDSGSLTLNDVNLVTGQTTLNLASATAEMTGKKEGSVITLSSNNVEIKGSLTNPQASLTVEKLALSGDLIYDQDKQDVLTLAVKKGHSATLTGEMTANGLSSPVKLNNLNIENTEFTMDLSSNKLSMKPGQGNQSINASYLQLPDVHLRNLKLAGSLEADLDSGIVDFDASKIQFSGKMGDFQIDSFSGKGQVHYDPSSGIAVKNAHLYTRGKIGDFGIKKLQGSGQVSLNSQGQLVSSNAYGLQLETQDGLSIKGNMSASYEGNIYSIKTSSKPVQINYLPQDQDIKIQNVSFQGQMDIDERTGELTFSNEGEQSLELPTAQIMDTDFENVELTGGELHIDSNGSFTIQPSENELPLTFNGTVENIKIENLKSSGPINVNATGETIKWKDSVSFSLPDYQIENLATNGSMSLDIDQSTGLVTISSDGGTLSGNFGSLNLQNLQLNGEITYNQNTGLVTFNGSQPDEDFEVKGQLNQHPMDIRSSGSFTIQNIGDQYEFTGDSIQLSGLVDGFSIESPEGSGGRIRVSNDFSTVDLKELNVNVKLEGIEFQHNDGLFKTTENGYEINLSGNFEAKQEKLFQLLDKFSENENMNSQITGTIKNVKNQLANQFSAFKDAEFQYDNLTIKLDHNFQLDEFIVDINTNITDAEVPLMIGRKATDLPLGEVNWSAHAEGDQRNFNITDGFLTFDLTQELRDQLEVTVKDTLKDAGVTDAELEIEADGSINISQAKYKVKAKGRRYNEGNEVFIPVLSKIFRRPKTVANINAKMELTVSVIDNQLVVSLDRLKVKNLIHQMISKAAKGEQKLLDLLEQNMKAEDVPFERQEGESLFSIDMNEFLSTQVDSGITLKDVQLSDSGNVQVQYTYQQNR